MSSAVALPARGLGEAARPPTGTEQNRVAAIDGFRACAVFMVYTFHVWQFCGNPVFAGHAAGLRLSWGALLSSSPAGVDLFMVLSGFCLFWPLCITPAKISRWSARDYFRRRIRRIVPPYYAALLYMTLLPNVLAIILHALHQPANWHAAFPLWQYVSHALFLHTLFPQTYNGIQPAFWSLGLEAQFYLVFPLVVMAYRKWGIKIVAGMIAGSVIYRVVTGVLTAHASLAVQFVVAITFLGQWMEFAAGMTAAWLVAKARRSGNLLDARRGFLVLMGSAGLYALAIPELQAGSFRLPIRELLLSGCFGAAIYAVCASRTPARRVFESRPVAALGFISYSVFLIHQNTVYYLGELLRKALHIGGGARFGILETAGFAAVVAIAVVFFRFFEAPFLNSPPSADRQAAGGTARTP